MIPAISLDQCNVDNTWQKLYLYYVSSLTLEAYTIPRLSSKQLKLIIFNDFIEKPKDVCYQLSG